MGTLTREELRAEIRKNTGNRPDSTDIQTRLNRLIELAQTRIARAHDWDELQLLDTKSITVVGVPATDKVLDLSDVTVRYVHSLVRYVASETPFKLIQMPQRQWAALHLSVGPDPDLEDATHYVLWTPSTAELWPVPNRNWTVERRLTTWPATFADDNAKSQLNNKDDLIIALVTHSFFQSLGQREDAQQWFIIYRDMLRDSIVEDQRAPDRSFVPRGIREGVIENTKPWADPFVKDT